MRKLKLFLSLLMLFTFSVGNVWATLPNNPTWEAKALADIADGSTIIIISNSTTATNIALPAAGAGTSNPPKRACTVSTTSGVTTITPPSGTTLQDLAWTLKKKTSTWQFFVEGGTSKWLYLSGLSSNTAVRVGTGSSNNEFTMGSAGKLLKVSTGTRFVGPNDNNGSDWRSYNSETASNYKGAQLTFYVLRAAEPTVSAVQGETDVVADGLSFTAKQNVAVTPQTFTLTGANLTEGLTLTSSSEAFVVSPTSLTKAEAEAGATITVTPATPTEATSPVQGTLTISGEEGLDDTEIALSMTVTPTYAVGVALNVKDKNDNVLTGENIPAGIAATIAGGASYYATNGESNIALAATTIAGWDFEGWTATAGTIADADAFSTTLTAAAEAATVTASFQEKKCTVLGTPTNVVVSGIAVANYPYESVDLAWDAVDNAAGYSVTIKLGENVVESNDVTKNAYSVSTTLTPNTEYTYEIIATNSDAAYCASNVATANFTTGDYPAATLTLSENGTTNNLSGDHKLFEVVTLPTELETAIEDMTLAGWSTVTVATTDTKPTGETFFEPGASFTLESTTQTLYAVYVEGHGAIDSWDLATSVTAGDVIVFATTPDNSTRKVNSSLGSNTYMSAVDASFSEDKQHLTALPTDAFPYTIGGNANDGWTLANGGQYLYISGDKKIALQDDATTWGLEFINDSARFTQDYKSSTYRMQYNSGNARFNVYTSNQQPVSIYKHVQEEANWHGYTTSFATKYTITIADDIQNGTVSADLAKASAGTTVTLTFTPAAHYRLSGWTLNGTAQDIAENTFAMPANDVVVSATFAEIKNAVNFDAPVGGTLVVKHNDVPITSGDEIQEGETLKLVYAASTEDHYIGGVVAVKDADNADVEVAADSTFVMPGKAVTVAATFTPTYAITAASVTGGSFSWEDDQSNANPAYVAAGTLIQAAADNATGYTFEAFDIYKTGEATTKVDHNDGLFEMPAYAVTIGGSFTENKIPEITLSQTEDYLFDDVAKGGSTSMTFTVSAAYLSNNITVAVSGTDAAKFGLSTTSITISEGGVENAEVTITPVTTEVGTFEATITVDDGEEGAAAKSFGVMIEVLETYTAKWIVNGDTEHPYWTQTAAAGTALEVPVDPTTLAEACSELVFRGWLTSELTEASTTAPEGLITETEGLTMPSNDINYYAVFAEEETTGDLEEKSVSTTMSEYVEANSCTVSSGSDVTLYTSLTLDENITLSTTGAPNCGSFWNSGAEWRIYQNKDGDAVVTASNGYTLKSVTFTYTSYNNGILEDAASATKIDLSGASATFDVINSGSATNGQVRMTAIAVEYEKNTQSTVTSNYVTSCPSCTTLPAPTNVTVTNITHEGATFSWDAVANAEGYYLEVALYSDTTYKKAEIGGLTPEQLSYGVYNLEAGTRYVYKVRAFSNDEVNYCDNGWGEIYEGDFTTAAPPKYSLKNNWNGGEWAWKEMTYVDGEYILENVVFGGTGVNWRQGDSGDGTWVELASFEGDNIQAWDTVTLAFNPYRSAITATLNSRAVVEFGGSWTYDWSEGKIRADVSSDNTYAAVKKELTKGEWYNFKPIVGGHWLGCSAGATEIKRTSNSVHGFVYQDGDNHIYFQADVTGEYEFKWVYTTNTVIVTFPDHTYTVAWTRNGTEDVEELGTLVRMGETNQFALTMEKEPAAATYTVSLLADGVATGYSKELVIEEHAKYQLYFEYNPEAEQENDRFTALASKIGIATEIGNTGDGQKAVKMMKDNTIYIIRGDKTYTITGQVVK